MTKRYFYWMIMLSVVGTLVGSEVGFFCGNACLKELTPQELQTASLERIRSLEEVNQVVIQGSRLIGAVMGFLLTLLPLAMLSAGQRFVRLWRLAYGQRTPNEILSPCTKS